MSLGERLTCLRKKLNLSQEEVADKLGVTRQTVSKWETDQSTPDFDKIIPICELYSISTNELINGEVEEVKTVDIVDNKSKRTKGIVLGIFLYFAAVISIMITIPVLTINPVVGASIFLGICAIATCIIIYTCITYKKEKKEKKEDKLYKQIDDIIAILFLILYLGISFVTMAWHITWILWIVYALITSIVKLIISLRGEKYEK